LQLQDVVLSVTLQAMRVFIELSQPKPTGEAIMTFILE